MFDLFSGTIMCALVLGSFSVSFAETPKPKLGDSCFSVFPQSDIDDGNCKPVKADIKIMDCKTGSVIDEIPNANMRFECKSKNKKLKYWFRETMYFAELEKVNGKYSISETHSLVYGKKDESTAVVSPMAAVKSSNVVPPVAHVNVAPPPQNAPVAAPPVQAPPTPVIPAAVPEYKYLPPLNEIKIGGAMDFYYLYNFNLPPPPTSGTLSGGVVPPETVTFLPKKYHDQFTLNLALLSVKKEAKPVGFKFELAYGPEAAIFSNDGKNSDLATTAVSQAVVMYKTPFDLIIEAGKFHAPVGFESHYAFENINYTDSYGHLWATPIWLTGVDFKMPLGDRLTLSLYVANGWNTQYENNASKTFGGQLKFIPVDEVEINLNAIGGNETPVGGADVRSTIEANASARITRELKFAVDFIMSQESISGGDPRRASSLTGYGQYWIIPNLALALRYEVYNDDSLFNGGLKNSTRPPAASLTLNSITGTIDYKLTEEFHVKGEYRTDNSNANPGSFVDNAGNPTATQSIALISGVLGL